MKSINAAVARYTGLPEAVVAQYGGRIPSGVFVKESRRDEKLLLSHYDASVAGVDPYPEQSGARSDPLYDPLRMVLTTGMADYLATSLKVHTDQPYRLVSGNVARQWNWRSRRLCERHRRVARRAGA